MNSMGQIHLEAIIVFAAFMAVIGMLLTSVNFQNNSMNSFAESFSSESNAQACAITANSLYANSFGSINSIDSNCGVFSEKIVSSNGKKAFSVALEIKSFNSGRMPFIAVTQNRHYW